MKTFLRVLGLLCILGVVLAIPAPSGAAAPGAMRVRLVDGDVQMKIADTGEWAPVAVNTPLLEGDELWVPDGSRAAIQTSNGAYVRLGGNTALEVLRMDRDAFQFHLSQGQAYVLSRTPRNGVLQLDTPDASIRAFGSAAFRIDIPDGETDVGVIGGSVVAESDAGTTTVRQGDMLVLAPGGYAELSPLPGPDDWEMWNRDLDRIVLARRASTRYLPGELQTYAEDFDDNGRWVYVQDYGYCWTPTVLVVRDWAPYRHGRWCWRGGDYVWIGYEPWGWAPYHYGRWAFVARVGWCWVPPERDNVYWGPGYVGWVRTGEYVAWVPLAPRETYYGQGYYGRYSVNVVNVNINTIRVTNVYRNVNVTNSITVVNQTTFVTGRQAAVDRNATAIVRDDFSRRRNIVVGRPAIRPAEGSYAPVVRGIPDAKRPPAEVRRIDARELRQTRPLVRESNRSAFRPAAKPRPLEVRKVDKARPLNERMRERREAAPAERRGPASPQGGPPGRIERGGTPGQAVPREPARREAPATPPSNRFERGGGPQAPPQERVTPGTPPGRIERGGTPGQAVPREPARREAPATPPSNRFERGGGPQAPPQERVTPGTPPGRIERGGTPGQAVPREPARREAPATPPSDRLERGGGPQAPPQERATPGTPPGRIERGGTPGQAVPREPARREAPATPPSERPERGGGKPAEERRNVEPAPAPVERGGGRPERPQAAPTERVRPQAPAPAERVRPETPPPPERSIERGRPEQPQERPDRGVERGGDRGGSRVQPAPDNSEDRNDTRAPGRRF